LKKQIFFLALYKIAQKTLKGSNLGKYAFVKSLESFVISKAKSNFVIIHGNKMYLDQKDSLDLSLHGSYETLETEFVKNEVKKNDIVIDIGANIGYYSLILAKIVGDKGKVFAFEPAPDNYSLLKKNIEINNYKNVVLENLAISDKNGSIELYLSQESMGWHRIYPSKYCGENHVKVKMVTLDDYFKENTLRDKISFVKMDVEGAELGILRGMTSILENNKKLTLLLEFVPHYIREFGSDPKELLNILKKQSFEISVIEEKSNEVKPVDNLDFLLEQCDRNDDLPQRINLICKRK
jgi:FkbM family methyltransferase